MILAQSTTDDIRRLHDIWVARLAFEYRCERDDVLAAIQPRPAAQAPAASAPAAAPASAQAEEVAPPSSADPSPDHSPDAGNMVEATPPQPTSTPAVQAQAVEPSSKVLDGPSPSLPGAESAADPAPVPSGGETAGKSGEASASPASPRRGRPDSTRAKVVAVHQEHPDWPSKLIAQHLSISEDAVRATASRKKLKLVSWWDYERAQAAAKASELRTAIEAQPKAAEHVGPAPAVAFQEVKPPAPEPSAKRVSGRQDQVLAIHAEHPEWPAKLIAEHMGVVPQYVTATASRLNLQLVSWADHLASAAVQPPTLSDRVHAVYAEHPDWTNGRIADHCGCSHSTVEAWLAAQRRKSKTAAPVLPPELEPLPAPEPATELVVAEPATTAPYSVAPKIARKAPQGRFYLRDQDGQFVHQSLLPSKTGLGPLMTTDRKWGWYDTMERYRGAKKQWPQIAFMTKDAVHS